MNATTKRLGLNIDTGLVHYMAEDNTPVCQRNRRSANLLDNGKVHLYEVTADQLVANPKLCRRCGVTTSEQVI